MLVVLPRRARRVGWLDALALPSATRRYRALDALAIKVGTIPSC